MKEREREHKGSHKIDRELREKLSKTKALF